MENIKKLLSITDKESFGSYINETKENKKFSVKRIGRAFYLATEALLFKFKIKNELKDKFERYFEIYSNNEKLIEDLRICMIKNHNKEFDDRFEEFVKYKNEAKRLRKGIHMLIG